MRSKVFSSIAVIGALALGISGCGSATHSPHPAGWGYPPKTGKLSAVFPQKASRKIPTRQAYDSVTLSTIPHHPFALAGYTSGYWPTYEPMRKQWPKAHTLSIAISASNHADCLDVEPGDAVPSQVVGWIRADRKAGFKRPCVYSSYWEYIAEIRPLIQAAHIKRSSIFEWDADYLSCPRLDSTFDATQCTDHAYGRNLDQSTVTLPFLLIAQPPYNPNAKKIRELKIARTRNEVRMKSQKCGHIPLKDKVDRARCSIERTRIVNLNREIQKLSN